MMDKFIVNEITIIEKEYEFGIDIYEIDLSEFLKTTDETKKLIINNLFISFNFL